MFPDRAGVIKDKIRIFTIAFLIADIFQDPKKLFRIFRIHLAAECVDTGSQWTSFFLFQLLHDPSAFIHKIELPFRFGNGSLLYDLIQLFSRVKCHVIPCIYNNYPYYRSLPQRYTLHSGRHPFSDNYIISYRCASLFSIPRQIVFQEQPETYHP